MSDGPASARFRALPVRGSAVFEGESLPDTLSEELRRAAQHAPRGDFTAWGIPFAIDRPVVISQADGQAVEIAFDPQPAGWLVFLHTSDVRPPQTNAHGFITPMRGAGQLKEHAADYVICYAGGGEECVAVRRRFEVGMVSRGWGENCFLAVSDHKPVSLPSALNDKAYLGDWGWLQTRADSRDSRKWTNWLFAWQNPHPERLVRAVRFEPVCGALVISGLAAGEASEMPLRWHTRRKALLRLPEGQPAEAHFDEHGLLPQIQLDMGTVISLQPRRVYPNNGWEDSANNQLPEDAPGEVLVEYAAHPDASFHLWDGRRVPVSALEPDGAAANGLPLEAVRPAAQRVNLKVVERGSTLPVAVKLHVHGEHGEYLAPVDRHRIINPAWFEDYSADFQHAWRHNCTYIAGETTIDLPLGKVYIEVSKGFEIKPVRAVVEVTGETDEIVIELERVLPWRARGWVTADTHVHFLSPMTAMLEGAAEGVNIVNLLASQWGELMTNVGDFDGRNTWGAREAGGDGEWLVRVGTENRQHVLGHISLLGYEGRIIAPMTTGGPDEAALGDPIEVLLTEWARQCKAQGGLVVLPHFPNPRAEHAASIVTGGIDALEMTSWGDLYSGINPYSLSDWYRYLNCGYLLAAVGGTDKMTANTAVGTVRTYARIPTDQPFTYAAWMEAVRRAETFVTYGPLLDFSVDGRPMGSQIELGAGGGTLDVTWTVASATIPATRVELVVNGEIRESASLDPGRREQAGSWRVPLQKSAWLALLVRGQYPGKPEVIAAHSSPVMARVAGSPLLAAADAVTILEQIEGAMVYLDSIGTRAADRAYKRMRLVLESAHRDLHNRMHQHGQYHEHAK